MESEVLLGREIEFHPFLDHVMSAYPGNAEAEIPRSVRHKNEFRAIVDPQGVGQDVSIRMVESDERQQGEILMQMVMQGQGTTEQPKRIVVRIIARIVLTDREATRPIHAVCGAGFGHGFEGDVGHGLIENGEIAR